MVSRVVHDQVQDKLSFDFDDMGEQTVKNISRPVGVPPRPFTERSCHAKNSFHISREEPAGDN